MTLLIRKQIKEWIRIDPKCVRLEAGIATLKRQRRQRWTRFRVQQQAEHWKVFREIKRIDDFRVAIMDRRRQVHQIAKGHARRLAQQSVELRRDLSRLDTKLALATTALGLRRGFLRKDLADRFVKLAAKEALRRCKL